jgi:hypothetical protein
MNKVIRMAIPLALLAVTPLQAQDIALGFKGGINIAKQDLNVSGLTLNLDSRTGFVGGAFATIGLGTTLFLQPEALYSRPRCFCSRKRSTRARGSRSTSAKSSMATSKPA